MVDINKTEMIHSDSLRLDDLSNKRAVLTFIRGEQVGRIVYLASDNVIFGRSPEATIMLNDNRVSRLHLRVEYNQNVQGYLAQDLGSSNGTYVNDKKIAKHLLTPGDKIILGATILRFSLVDSLDIRFQGELERLMNIDELTGLLVPRRFNEELSRMIAVSHKDRSALCMLLMDMDGLKKINDTYGHQFGAFAISETGKIIKQIISEKGMASRFGGDEFMAFLVNSKLEDGLNCGENIRSSVEKYKFEKDEIKIFPTISIGVATLKNAENREQLFKRADQALYRAKREGRNRVCQ